MPESRDPLVEPRTDKTLRTGLEALLGLFNVKRKSELESYCRDLVIDQHDFVNLILSAQTRRLPYLYANHFDEIVGGHLKPREEELDALAANGVGPLTDTAKKAVNRIGQLFKERKLVAAHLFYTPDHRHWNLFYMLQGSGRDTDPRENHWRHGPHMHFVSDLWGQMQLAEVWNRVQVNDLRFPSLHIRFTGHHIKAAQSKRNPPVADSAVSR